MKLSCLALFIALLTPLARLHAQASAPKPEVPVSAQQAAPESAKGGRFAVEQKSERLVISHSGQPVADFIFRDDRILRPYFANVHAPGGLRVTRNHPPIAAVDAIDHDTMHPGIWLGFGDLSGADFWRNKGRIEHVRFTESPTVAGDRLTFATESRLLTADGKTLCRLASRIILAERPAGWLLVWDATFHADDGAFTFGDQEEMGFGARVATPLTEKNGGRIVNSAGRTSAAATWGQPAAWCDYSGAAGERRGGITLMAARENFRESWWHNRDYGVFVANPFGRAAMKQGDRSAVTVEKGGSFHLRFAAFLYDTADYNPATAFEQFRDYTVMTTNKHWPRTAEPLRSPASRMAGCRSAPPWRSPAF